MSNVLNRRSRERAWLVPVTLLAVIGVWPAVLTPLGQAYVLFCARFLTDAPFRHHFPPLLVAFIGLIVLVLLVGFGIALARQVVGQRKLDAGLAARRDEPDERMCQMLTRLGIEDRIIITNDVDEVYAFCSGLLRTRIYLSRGLLSLLTPAEIEAVLRHELHHLRRCDPLRLFLGNLMAGLSIVMPVLAALEGRLRIRVELAADREVVSTMGVETLAAAIVKVDRAVPAIDHQVVMAAFSPAEARVAGLLGNDVEMPFNWRDLATSALFIASLVALATWLSFQSLPLPPECQVCPSF